MPRLALSAAVRELAARDPKLAVVLAGPPPGGGGRRGDLYRDLLEAVVAQQLSGKAAATIFERFLDLFPHRRPEPRRLLALRPEQLRAAGLSRQKAGYLRNIAAFARRHDLRRAALRRASDEEIIARLTQIKGVGRWTAEMLLMFSLQRPDVFPVDDLGIQLAMRQLYGLRSQGPRLRRRMIAIAEAWRPHRTLACRCLWRWRNQAKARAVR